MEFLKSEKPVINILKGTLIAFSFTIFSLTIFSSLLVYTNLSEEIIKPVIITVTGISILIGSSIGTKKLKRNGLINGAIIGVAYILLIYLISSAVNGNFLLNSSAIILITVRNNMWAYSEEF